MVGNVQKGLLGGTVLIAGYLFTFTVLRGLRVDGSWCELFNIFLSSYKQKQKYLNMGFRNNTCNAIKVGLTVG